MKPVSAEQTAVRTQLQAAEQHLRTGQLAAAEEVCRALLTREPRNAAALLLLGLSLAQARKYEAAESAFLRCVEVSPKAASAYANLGNLYLLKGDAAGAEHSYRKALAINPQQAESHFNLGLALKAQGRLPESLSSLREASRIKPDYVDAHVQTGVIRLAQDDVDSALKAFDQALRLRDNHFGAHYNRGLALMQLGRLEEAKLSLARAAAIDPRSTPAFFALGQALHRLGELPLATSSLARAVALSPDNAEAHAALAAAFLEDGWTMAALDEAEKSLKIDPHYSFGLIVHGRVLADLNRLDESIAAHERAVGVAPDSLEALIALGTSYLSRGRTDAARETFLKARSTKPDDARILLNLARTDRFTVGDANFRELEAVLADADRLLPNERIELFFTAGRVLDEAGDYAGAFRHFETANRLQSERSKQKEQDQIALHERIKEIFSKAFIEERLGGGSGSTLPIFILGMPRSGTTLCEQIISNHPAVAGAGEVLDLEIAIKILSNKRKFTTPMPDLVCELSAADLRELGEIYASRLAQRAPNAAHVTDKLPGNFNRVGLIRLALPNAKIIHCVRSPMDCCFSIYSNHFVDHLEHANDLEKLGRFYRRYHNLMAHWRDVLPANSFLDVAYEDMVHDIETTARRVVAYCGLEWDDRCLDFQSNIRQVVTLSITQVRKPIYTSSVERWRHYETQLKPLRDALGELAASNV